MGIGKLAAVAAAIGASLLIGGAASAAIVDCKPDVRCTGTSNNDALNGTSGRDDMHGKAGFDLLRGRGGSDHMNGGVGVDELRGGRGYDVLIGGPDGDSRGSIPDELYGGRGNDTLRGGMKDTLFGGRGDDILYGSSRKELLNGGPGDDVLHGGLGSDIFMFEPNWGDDKIVETSGPNTLFMIHVTSDLSINLVSSLNGPEVTMVGGTWKINWENNAIRSVLTGSGNDTVWGNDEVNVIQAQFGGSDNLYGAGGNDVINAREGSDDDSPDTIDCGPGDADVVFYDEDYDTVINCEILNPDQ